MNKKTDYRNIKVGTKVKINLSQCGLAGYAQYSGVYTVVGPKTISGPSSRLCFKETDGINNCTIYASNVTIVSYSIKDLEEQIKTLQEEINDVQSIVDYLKETGLEEYDENQHKVYKTLQLLKKKDLTDLEKSVLIAKMLD